MSTAGTELEQVDALTHLRTIVEELGGDEDENQTAWKAFCIRKPHPLVELSNAIEDHSEILGLLSQAVIMPGMVTAVKRFRDGFEEQARAALAARDEAEFSAEWGGDAESLSHLGFDLTGNGQVKAHVENAVLAFTKHDAWSSGTPIRWNELANRVEVRGVPLDDVGITRAQRWAIKAVGVDFGPDRTFRALEDIGRQHAYHPVREYLSRLKWDGVSRIWRLLPDYFATDDTAYHETVGARFMIGAVARAMQPGCKHRSVLVLSGAQNVGKSEGLRRLAGAWFRDSHFDPTNKDFYALIQGVWLYEIPEIDKLLDWRSAGIVKSFVSQTDDTYRPPYGRCTVTIPRTAVFAGTTNEAEYLTDATGSTRFWPAAVRGRVDLEGIDRDRDQLWAEALVSYRQGERWHLDEAEEAQRVHVASSAEVEDPIRPSVSAWAIGRRGFTTAEVLAGALGIPNAKANSGEGRKVGACLRALGWFKSRDVAGAPDREMRWYRE